MFWLLLRLKGLGSTLQLLWALYTCLLSAATLQKPTLQRVKVLHACRCRSGPATDADLEALARQGSLQRLDISGCIHLTDAAMATLAQLLPCLTSLSFSTTCRGVHQATSQVPSHCWALAMLACNTAGASCCQNAVVCLFAEEMAMHAHSACAYSFAGSNCFCSFQNWIRLQPLLEGL